MNLDVEIEREAELEKIRKEKDEQSALKNKMSTEAKGTVKSILTGYESQLVFFNDELFFFWILTILDRTCSLNFPIFHT